jgi:ferredoxin
MFKREKARPEVANRQVVVDRNLCFYCGACVAVCPPDSIFLENAHLKIDHNTCTLCERCTNMCPVHALSMQPPDHTLE